MRASTRRVSSLAVATAAAATFSSLSCAALPAAPAQPEASFTLAIHRGRDATGPVEASATLDCFPAGGTHPHPDAACRALAEVDGDFQALPRAHVICPHIVDPVTVTAIGHWFGRPVHYQRTFPNRCEAAAGTDDVFAF